MTHSALESIWRRIVDEMVYHQDLLTEECQGHVLNPINNSIYVRDTAFAAQIFAAEHQRTKKLDWLERAKAAFRCLREVDPYSGMEEPKWNRFGWHYNKGSLAATGISLDSMWETMQMLQIPYHSEPWADMVSYIDTCRVGEGLYAHDAVAPGKKPSPVLNTTAIVLYLLVYANYQSSDTTIDLSDRIDAIFHSLYVSQMNDGFWPYTFPTALQRSLFDRSTVSTLISRTVPLEKFAAKWYGDRFIKFGDAVHHCLVLFYLCKAVALQPNPTPYLFTIENGWKWITNHLIDDLVDGLSFDFSWEPVPNKPRFCNFRETSTYFLICAMQPYLRSLGIVSSGKLCDQLLMHVYNDLLEPEGIYPGILPYEGPEKILRNILPRVGESVAWKGSCLAEIIREDKDRGRSSSGH